MKEGPCHFCDRRGPLRAEPGKDPVAEETFVCPRCWTLLKNPATALPLIRGQLATGLRGKVPEERLNGALNEFMGRLAELKRPG